MRGETGRMLRNARRRAGITQDELARRAGLRQPTVAAYETGAREPSVETFRRLVGAVGMEIQVVPAPLSGPDPLRNGCIFADVLSLVDAMPFDHLHRAHGRVRPEPPTWAALVSRAEANG